MTPSHDRQGGASDTYVVQPGALVVLEQPVLAAEASPAEVAVPRDALWLIPAVWEAASHLLGRHAFGFVMDGRVSGCRSRGLVGRMGGSPG